jgi:hypothetical protein
MGQALLQRTLPNIAQRRIVESFEDIEREGLRTMRAPRRLQGMVGGAAMPSCEPEPALDGVEVKRPSDPSPARRTADDAWMLAMDLRSW